MYLEWGSCDDGVWCALADGAQRSPTKHGVYIIWQPSTSVLRPSSVIRVGHGGVRDALRAESADPAIGAYGPDLLVTWAEVDPALSAGVAKYLTELLRPLEASRVFLESTPISVNLPLTA
jgi:hypothetical protein